MFKPAVDLDPQFDRGNRPTEPAAVRPLVALLHQLFDLVESLTNEEYTCKPVGVVPSSFGGHVRHNLDHIAALIRGISSGEVNYDHRERGTDVERDRLAAMTEILQLEQELNAIDWCKVPKCLKLSAMIAHDQQPVTTVTCLERELAFVVSHTVHHNSIIGIMAKLLGKELPADFGYAPSTLAYQRSRSCAR